MANPDVGIGILVLMNALYVRQPAAQCCESSSRRHARRCARISVISPATFIGLGVVEMISRSGQCEYPALHLLHDAVQLRFEQYSSGATDSSPPHNGA